MEELNPNQGNSLDSAIAALEEVGNALQEIGSRIYRDISGPDYQNAIVSEQNDGVPVNPSAVDQYPEGEEDVPVNPSAADQVYKKSGSEDPYDLGELFVSEEPPSYGERLRN